MSPGTHPARHQPLLQASVVFSLFITPNQITARHHKVWLKDAMKLQEPQVRPAQRAMEMLTLLLQDRQDFREPDWTRPGIKLL